MPHLLKICFAGWMASALVAQGQTFESLHSFSRSEGGGSKGELIQARDGGFYGTASTGGDTNIYPFGYGSIFRASASGVVTNLVSFQNTNGASPWAGLVEAVDGNFYGTTYSGGASNVGTVFKVSNNGVLTMLGSFTNANGAYPMARLTPGSDGAFYGSTSSGGDYNNGTLFKISADGILTTLVMFDGTNGAAPKAALTAGENGDFYGTTYSGGASNAGVFFRFSTNGTLTPLASFGAPGIGKNPQGELFRGAGGNFYGTTFIGGANDVGTVFSASTNGILTTLFFFSTTDGSHPSGALVQGNDGNLYGTTLDGGTASSGTVFRISFGGQFASIYSFNAVTNGITPLAGLVQSDDGNLYGTTYSGGNAAGSGIGTLFRLIMPPVLTSHLEGSDLVLSWRTNATGFTLQSTTNLNAPVVWIDSTNVPSVSGKTFNVTNGISDAARFYRLKK